MVLGELEFVRSSFWIDHRVLIDDLDLCKVEGGEEGNYGEKGKQEESGRI